MGIWDWFHRSRCDRELHEEIEAHIALAIRERVERGENPEVAELEARKEFGNRTLIRETTRSMWGWNPWDQLAQDLRYAIRGLRANPIGAAVVVSSLAIGLGANLGLFTLVYSALLRPLPVSHPEELVELLQKYPGEPRGNGYWTSRSYEFYRDHNHVFSSLTGTSIDNVARVQSEDGDATERVVEFVKDNYFSFLGLKPAHGEWISETSVSGTGDRPAVVSWWLWQIQWGRSPRVLGERIVVNDVPAVVVGVAPRAFTGVSPHARTEVWLPADVNAPGLNLLGRLKPDVTLEQARAEMKQLYRFTIDERAASSSDPLVQKLQVEVEPARSGMNSVRDRVRQPLLVLMTLVSVLLLLACVNVAGMLLARAAAREREMAVRMGLGASRTRLLRQVLTESCLLSSVGAVLGIAMAYSGTAFLLRILDSGRPHERVHLAVQIDLNVVLFAVAITLVTGMLFGAAPALHSFRSAPSLVWKHSGRAVQTRFQRSLGRWLVATQVALAVVLVSSGAVFAKHLSNLKNIDLGFRRDHVLLVNLDPSRSGLRGERLSSAYRQLIDHLHMLPGVRSVSMGAPSPLSGAGASGWMTVDGFNERPSDRRRISLSWVAPEYFATLGTPILAGREFHFDEEKGTQKAILSESAAGYYFGGRNPMGRQITLDQVTNTRGTIIYEVIGVVRDANYRDLREADRSVVYLPAFRAGRVTNGTFMLRTALRPEAIAGDVRRTVRDAAPSISIREMTTLSLQVDSVMARERLIAFLSGFFAVSGALLAGVGLFGLLAYTVARRTNEIGVRMALGATSGWVLKMVVREGLAIAALGGAIGILLTLWARRLTFNLVQDVTTSSLAALCVSLGFLLSVAVLASYFPARRAACVDPMQSLRHE